MAEFKKLSDVEVVAEPTESANVLIEENGIIKKTPKSTVGGDGGIVINFKVEEEELYEPVVFDFDSVRNAIMSGLNTIAIDGSGWVFHLVMATNREIIFQGLGDGTFLYLRSDGTSMYSL